MDLLQAEITGHLPLLAELKVAVEEANQRAEKEEREKLLKEAAERLQQEQQAISEKRTQLEQPVEQKMVWNADIHVWEPASLYAMLLHRCPPLRPHLPVLLKHRLRLVIQRLRMQPLWSVSSKPLYQYSIESPETVVPNIPQRVHLQ